MTGRLEATGPDGCAAEELLARRGLADVIADDYVTLRNNRFVVPVRTRVARICMRVD